ncbi:TB2/DP1, HVA22 family-domain-containing protein [Kickxella alabastrina]|uniref:TB2/DP1, HVA22 family-domain-containing protein n=1 Tax=Kickxella alabastrina TaxID=61397 RepID=UPI00221E6E54|nr:TB2/DP1, HVA22 family-domain-containing protein [Kickxella alabastrina]KAI7823959.1 TB2/DP1, HVA22 family-domain-containing protein [Kickxella alabastrina]
MEQARKLHDQYYGIIDRALSGVGVAETFQAKTGVPKAYGAVGAGGLIFSMVFFNIAAPLLVNLIGFGYAAYATMHAIESPGKEDDAQWLTYWVVYGFLNVVEYFTRVLTYWIPFYFVIKLGFIVWLMLPATRGAEQLYQRGLRALVVHSNNKPTGLQVHSSPSTSVPTPLSDAGSVKVPNFKSD